MSNPTLINGFEDIITFIKQQDKRMENLVRINEQLKEHNNGLKEELYFSQDQYEKLKQENQELQKQNQYYINMFNAVVESETEKVKEINKLMKLIQVYKNTIDSDHSNSDDDYPQ
jgi:FtsZ-binding cell division protein ZapB